MNMKVLSYQLFWKPGLSYSDLQVMDTNFMPFIKTMVIKRVYICKKSLTTTCLILINYVRPIFFLHLIRSKRKRWKKTRNLGFLFKWMSLQLDYFAKCYPFNRVFIALDCLILVN